MSATRRLAIVVLGIGMLLPLSAAADLTGVTGGSQPQSTIQPSLALNYIVRTEGDFNHLGDVNLFAGNFAPGGFLPADGRLLPISQHDALFAVLGTTYGGDGQTTFALPDLRGRAPIGMGNGPGLSPRTLGQTVGTDSVTLTTANLPPHIHTLPGSGSTDITGSGVPYINMQPSLTLNYTIPLQGVYPSRDGGGYVGPEPVLGFVGLTARSSLPNGWTTAQGQLLPINQNQALFSLLGTTYGGNGINTFALPDLRGRAAIGQGDGPGLTPQALGEMSGVESVSLSTSQLPPHLHTLPPSSDLTGITGAGLPQNNMQPTLGLSYVIATSGIFPSRDGGGTNDEPLLGQIGLFAGNFAPGGWTFADGRLLPISQNTALFSLLGTTYGGDGKSTFALPDLRGTLALNAGDGPGLTLWDLGQMDGVESLTMTVAEMAAHNHTFVVPEPAALGLIALGSVLPLWRRRR